MVLLILSMLIAMPLVVHAEHGSGEGGEGGSGSAETGINFSNSAFLVTLVDQSGNQVAGSQQALVANSNPAPGQFVNRAGTVSGYSAKYALSSLWNCYAWNSSKTGSSTYAQSGNGGKIKQWLLQKPSTIDATYSSNATYVAVNVCKKNGSDLAKEIANGADYYLLVTNLYWNHMLGGWTTGNAQFWGGQTNANEKTRWNKGFILGCYQWSAKLETNGIWAGLTPLPRKSRYEVSEATGEKNGLGCVAIHLTDNYQVVICIENKATGKWTTEYLSSGLEYTVQDPYKNAKFVEGEANKEFTKATSASATYNEVCSSAGEKTRGAGVGAFKFNTDVGEHALFLHYVTDMPEPEISDADLYAWELSYRMPHGNSGDHTELRTLAETGDYGVYLDDVIYEWQMSTKPATPAGSDTVKYQWVVKKKSVKHTYTMSGSQGDFTKAIWNLYRESAPHYDLWDTYNEALGDDEWNGWESVDPKFSYYLMRSQLEGLALRPVPSSGLASMLVAGKGADFEDNWKDIGKGASQAADSVKTWENVCTYKFSYTGTVINEQTEGRAEAWIVWKLQKATRSWVSASGSKEDGTYKAAHWSSWSAWSDTGTEKEFKQRSFSPSKWNGTYASYNIDKYKTMPTGTGSSEQAGNYTVKDGSSDGMNLNASFASQIGKGGAHTIKDQWGKKDIHNAATHASQFKYTVYNLYGEVGMLYWKNNDTENYDTMTAQNTYVMSEYERHIIPPLVHGFKTKIVDSGSGKMEGMGSLTTPATGKTASDIKSSSQATDLGVTYMGTGFNVATTSKYRIDFGTAGLTISDNDEGANAEWGNEPTEVADAHYSYIDSVCQGLGQEIIMEFKFKPSGQTVYYTLLTATDAGYDLNGGMIGKDDVSFKRGSASGGDVGDVEPHTNGGVSGFLALTNMFDGTMISENEHYAGQSNKSGPAHEANIEGNHSGQYNHIGYSNWYDEESNHRFCIEKYHSWLVLDYMMAEDKIDYNLLTQNVASKYLNQNKYIEVRFYSRLYRENCDYTDGYYSWPGAPTLRIDRIRDKANGKDLSFSVINQSTSDMKKN